VAAFIGSQRDDHRIPATAACKALGVSRSWYYKWRGGLLPPGAERRRRLAAEIKRLFELHGGKYGSPRITDDLRDGGWRVSENTVAAVMREQHLAARAKKKRRSTTRPAKGRWRAPDLVKRDFPAAKINQKWFGDGTEIATDEGKLHLASVLDMGSRRVLGFALSEQHNAQLAYGALTMAVAVRGGQVPGVVFHTDQGSEDTARSFQAACQRLSITQSMGRPGSAPTTRSSNRGTPRWSSSCGAWSTSPPGKRRGPKSPPGSRTTTPPASTRRWACAAHWPTSRPWRLERRPDP
jgi:putative transposase